jgi:hypothetical protein
MGGLSRFASFKREIAHAQRRKLRGVQATDIPAAINSNRFRQVALEF